MSLVNILGFLDIMVDLKDLKIGKRLELALVELLLLFGVYICVIPQFEDRFC
jgi:hypothetical protein